MVYAMLILHKRLFISLHCLCPEEVKSSQPSPKMIISESKRPFLNCLFLFFFFASFIMESMSKMQVLPFNMVDIFCIFRNCNDYNFISFFFFMKRSSVTFVYIIFCCVVFNSKETSSTVVQTYVFPKSLIHVTYHSSGSQLLSNNRVSF